MAKCLLFDEGPGPLTPFFWVSSNMIMGSPPGSAGKESTCNVGDLGLIPGLGRSPEEGKGYPLQHSDLENSMDSPWSHKGSDTTKQRSLHFNTIMCSVTSIVSESLQPHGL